MPFPGSQKSDTVNIAYSLDHYIIWLRLLGWLLILPGLIQIFGSTSNAHRQTSSAGYPASGSFPTRRKSKRGPRIAIVVVLGLYGFIFYMFNVRFLADKMFLQPRQLQFTSIPSFIPQTDTGYISLSPTRVFPDSIGHQLAITVTIDGQSKAYPIGIIGYHHQVRDSIAGQPIMVTYCTVCRTGRVYSPLVEGRPEQFRLVGMDHFNAMFEDATTHSWWRQATGQAITGPRKGMRLHEIPSEQMSLENWAQLHPSGKYMQPDPSFRAKYDSLRGFDEGTISSDLEKRDTGSWQFKSWVIGVSFQGVDKAYDWNRLVKERVIFDSTGARSSGGHRFVLTMDPYNNTTYYALSIPDTLALTYEKQDVALTDKKTQNRWYVNGRPYEYALNNTSPKQPLPPLQPIPAYQEFWHSWHTFHPATSGGDGSSVTSSSVK